MKCENCDTNHEGDYGSGRFCNMKCARSFSTKHNRQEISIKIGLGNKGKTRSTEVKQNISAANKNRSMAVKTKIGQSVSKYYNDHPESRIRAADNARSRIITPATRKKLSAAAIANNFGGHTSKRKMYFRKNTGEEIYLQSSYEIMFAELLESLHITWSRPEPFIWYDDNCISHRYYPDFKVGEIYIDTKNDYLAVKDAEKCEKVRIQNNIDLRIVTRSQITKEFVLGLMPLSYNGNTSDR